MPAVGSGSDYVAFLHHSGIASINAGFGDSGGVYHSIYDSFDWYTHFSDKDFSRGRSLTQIMSTALLRMSDAPVLPFEFKQVVVAVRGYLTDLSKQKELQLTELHTDLGKLQTAADAYESTYKRALETPAVQARLNQILIETERVLAPSTGLPGRTWYKHQLMAPGLYTGYSAKTLPGIREAAEGQRWQEANEQAKNVTSALRSLRIKLEEASSLLAQ
jgi:N-acetylated-alpha-linked acidic dipeptidase